MLSVQLKKSINRMIEQINNEKILNLIYKTVYHYWAKEEDKNE